MAKLTERQRHPLNVAAKNARGEIGWLGPLDVTRIRWKRFMHYLCKRGLFKYLGNDVYAITEAGRLALSQDPKVQS